MICITNSLLEISQSGKQFLLTAITAFILLQPVIAPICIWKRAMHDTWNILAI